MCRKTLPRSKGIETPTTSPLSGRGTRRKTRPVLKGLKRSSVWVCSADCSVERPALS